MLKVHMSLPVTDLAATEAFYTALFDVAPAKKKADYLKFDPAEPALNISFIPAGDAAPYTNRHLGIQFSSQADLDTAYERLAAANLIKGKRETAICCYADQDKFWVTDPDGYEWELYYLLSDSEIKIQAETSCCVGESTSKQSACC